MGSAYGRDAVWVETSDGKLRLLPLAWTTLRPRPEPLAVEGRAVRLAPEALRELTAWVAARAPEPEASDGGRIAAGGTTNEGGQEVGHFDKHMQTRDPDGAPSDPAGGPARGGGGDVRAGARDPSRRDPPAAMVGQAGSPGAGRRERQDRGKR